LAAAGVKANALSSIVILFISFDQNNISDRAVLRKPHGLFGALAAINPRLYRGKRKASA